MATELNSARAPEIGEITRLLQNMRDGDAQAAEQLLSRDGGEQSGPRGARPDSAGNGLGA